MVENHFTKYLGTSCTNSFTKCFSLDLMEFFNFLIVTSSTVRLKQFVLQNNLDLKVQVIFIINYKQFVLHEGSVHDVG